MPFCSVTPIVIGGFMTYYNYLDAASFVAIYLVSHNIGYQFQELAYFTNTRKANRTLLNKYQKLLGQSNFISPRTIRNIFPIQLDTISLEKDGNSLPVSDFHAHQARRKNCHYRGKWLW